MIEQPMTLPCGHVVPNRLCKAAMTEGLADVWDRPTPQLLRLYRGWARGGAGLLLTGNVMIDRRYLERAGNVVVEDERDLPLLKEWADTVHAGGSQLWAQLNHPGRQCQRLVSARPLAPSEVQLELAGLYGPPRAASEDDLTDIIRRFVTTATVLKAAGFDGVQVHAAHGYLLAQFLSARTNLRTDRWGGSVAHRSRLLLEVVHAVRQAVGPRFPVAVKINSADFVKGGFTLEECLEVVTSLDGMAVDFIELSGGTYERLAFLDGQRDSTRAREAMFLEYAARIKKVIKTPLMVTGGFRTRAGMEAALASGETDLIGLARPLCVTPDAPARLLAGTVDGLSREELGLQLGSGLFGPASPSATMRALNAQAQVGWYYAQLERLGEGLEPDTSLSAFGALVRHLTNDTRRIFRRRKAQASAQLPAVARA